MRRREQKTLGGNKMVGNVIDVGSVVDEKKASAFHIKIVAICFLIMLIDGFDISVAAFAGPGLIRQFHVSPSALGALFSVGLLAGLFGTPIFGSLADRFGRKRVIIFGVFFFGVFTLAALIATSFQLFVLYRFIAGVGIAGILPIAVALASEFAPRRYRATMVILMFTGSSLGGVTVGLVAAQFAVSHGWQILFWVGGVGPLLLVALLIFSLPESPHYMVGHPNYRSALVKVVKRLDPNLVIDDNTVFMTTEPTTKEKAKISALFAGRLAYLTPLIWAANIFSMMAFYFTSSWLPTILSASSVGASKAALAASLYILAGTVGGLAIMRPLDRFGFLPIPVLFFCGIPFLVAIGLPGLSQPLLLAVIIMAGFCIYGLQFGLIAMEGPIYPPAVRGRGLGFCFAAARLGASIGPLLGGFLIGYLNTQELFTIFAIPLVAGGLAASVITYLYRQQTNASAGNSNQASAQLGADGHFEFSQGGALQHNLESNSGGA
jgi:MFS transporter, AAHS family, 4-hydroxybenzoate transporter